MAMADALKAITTRKLLVLSALLVICAFIGIIALGNAMQSGEIPDYWSGLISLILAGGTICATVTSYIHAVRHDRNGVMWALGSLMFPYVVPLVLAALPAKGSVAVHSAEDAAELHSVLVGKWICQCGVIRSDGCSSDVCDDCGKPLLRFHPAERGQSCNSCGFRFSDIEVTTEDTMQDIWARKGFRCNDCGSDICLNCMPTDAEGGMTHRCHCGGTVAIRI